eukprot:CCRYP_011915-RA/>CCRYP_011915-RA protein AED:0.45 eAED:0.45 QI:0/0/0/0.5/1/1/2/0/228
MSYEKIMPIEFKHQECECRRGDEKAPIRYVPDRDPVQEALDIKPESLKCTFANGPETRVTVWSGHGANEQFILYVNKAYSTAKKMRLIPTCDDAKKAYDLKKDSLSKTEKEKKTAESLSLNAGKLALRTKMTDLTLAVFQLYTNLLTEEARQPWDLIVKEQTESNPFHNIFGVKWKKSPGKHPSHLGGASYSTSNCVSHMTQARVCYSSYASASRSPTRFVFINLCNA